jgi:hypothetical protein
LQKAATVNALFAWAKNFARARVCGDDCGAINFPYIRAIMVSTRLGSESNKIRTNDAGMAEFLRR